VLDTTARSLDAILSWTVAILALSRTDALPRVHGR
jgi:hypothetical protein